VPAKKIHWILAFYESFVCCIVFVACKTNKADCMTSDLPTGLSNYTERGNHVAENYIPLNPLMSTLKPLIGTLAVDGWAVTFGTSRRGLGGLRLCPVPFSLYQM